MDHQSNYKVLFHFWLLLLAIFICYSNTLDASWHFDDIPNIVSNQNNHANDLSWKELKKSFYSPETNKVSRPVSNLTFAVNYYISGLHTTSYHLINILIHIFGSWFAYLVFRQTLRLYALNTPQLKYAVSLDDIALLGAMLWAIHPIQTQAVTYIVQRMTSLAALFCIIAFYFYLRFRLCNGAWRKGIYFVMTTLFFLLGLGSKENAILLPLTLAGYEVAFFRTSLLPSKKYARYLILFGVIIIISTIIYIFSDKIAAVFEVYNVRKFTLWERLLTQPFVLSRYLFLIVYPLSDFLVLETDMVAFKGLFDPLWTLIPILFITSLILFSIINLNKFPLVCFALFYYFVGHSIESTFIPLEIYFEHRNYLPSLFIFLAVAYYIFKLISYYADHNKLLIRNLMIFAVVIILIGEGNAAYLRNDVWRDEISLHSDTINKFPENLRPYVAIAVTKITERQYDEALEYLRKAEALYKQYPGRFQENWISKVYYNAGLVFKNKKENGKAIKFFTNAIFLNGYEWSAHANLGLMYFEKGEYKKAEDFLYNAVQLHGKISPELYNLYGRTLYANEKYDEAIEAFMAGLKVKDMRLPHYNLAAAYLKLGLVNKAKSVILTIPYDESKSDLNYYLYRAFIFSDDDRSRVLNTLASIIVNREINYCDLIDKIGKNNSVTVIYPDISDIEGQLKTAYQNELAKMQVRLKGMSDKADECELLPAASS